MADLHTEEYYRAFEAERAEEGEKIRGIRMEALPETSGYRFYDDSWDEDGDGIQVKTEMLFRFEGEGYVNADFAQGTDPAYVARVLRKFADMLESPQGHQLVNLGLLVDDADYARRREDGTVVVSNAHEEQREWERMRREEERDDDTSPMDD